MWELWESGESATVWELCELTDLRGAVMQTMALILTVFVDIVRPGRGLVTGQGWSGGILRDRDYAGDVPGSGPYIVEDEAGDVIARARSYRAGALKLAEHYGHPKAGVRVDVEDETAFRL